MRAEVGARSDVGQVREGNEDSFLIRDPVFVVADGMGGHIAGDVASRLAVETIERELTEVPSNPEALAKLIRDANGAIWNKAQSDTSLRGMGTTCTLVFLDGTTAHLAHVGDSRAYLFRDGELSQLTEDHTLVGRMVKEGRLKPEEAEHHPQRSIITRALGVDEDVDVDLLSIEVKEGDRLLICSDGLTGMVGKQEIARVLATESQPQGAADRLVELANQAGGEDNITVLILDIKEGDAPARSAGAASVTEAPPPAPPPVREPTDPRSAPEEPAGHRSRGRGLRVLLTTILVIALLAGGGYAAARYFLSNSWFVGVNEDNVVTIYKGIPEEIAGLSFREEEEATDIQLASLPSFIRDNLQNGIKTETLVEAEQKVTDIRQLAKDAEFQKPTKSGKNN
jgi:protein phosphatase